MTEPTNAALLPGLTLCAQCRWRDAFCTESPGERDQRFLCAECADDMIEAACALELAPAFVDVARTAREEWARPLPLPQLRWEDADQSKLLELRAQWRAYERTLTDASRCWAFLPNGARCIRAESEGGLCETHLFVGAKVPGLGWAGGEPRGRIMVRRGRSAA